MNCISCKRTNITKLNLSVDSHSVTSDCQPVEYCPNIYFCNDCNLVQKRIDDDYRALTNQIYKNYKIYDQAGGAEQAVFTQSGDSVPRSKVILDWLTTNINLKDQGKLLEIGCGNGSFLRMFSKHYDWALTGTEFDDRNRQQIESIKNSTFYTGDFTEINEQFDLLVCIHVLEHIYDPREFLINCSKKLTKAGKILIEVPDIDSSPFDIFIADHCSHFSINSLVQLAKICQLKLVSVSNKVVGKEITIILEKDEPSYIPALVGEYQSLTKDLVNQIKALGSARKIGIFGSSIAATVIASKLGSKIDFFIDEDLSKIGNYHLGLPILAIADAPSGAAVALPMSKPNAFKIATRLAGRDIKFLY